MTRLGVSVCPSAYFISETIQYILIKFIIVYVIIIVGRI
jgi:hypothetical protein